MKNNRQRPLVKPPKSRNKSSKSRKAISPQPSISGMSVQETQAQLIALEQERQEIEYLLLQKQKQKREAMDRLEFEKQMQKNIEARDFINIAFDGMENTLKLNQEINSEGQQQSEIDEDIHPREYSIN